MRGKTRIGTSTMILSILLATIMAFGVAPVFAVGTIQLPTIVNPLATPGTTFITDVILVGYPSTTYINHVEYKVHYDPAILNVYTVVPNRASPVYLSIIDNQVIDNVNGVLTFSVTRTPKPAPDPGGFIADFAILESVIGWNVMGIGTTTLHFTDVVITDRDGNNVPTGITDGFFDNRLQATISAPSIIDTSLVPGDYFQVPVSIGPWHDNPLQKMWGFQFILSFDPGQITPVDYYPVVLDHLGNPFEMAPSEIGPDYVAFSANSYFGDTVGVSATAPVVVAEIGFVVLHSGVTPLTLHDAAIADVYGNSLLLEVESGSFTSAGKISLPTMVNPTATPGTSFITDVVLAGYLSTQYINHVEYKVHYDPAILNVYTVVPNRASPVYLSIIDNQVIDNVNGVLTFSVTRRNIAPYGFIADFAILESVIGWNVMGIGTTTLHFTDVVITDRDGNNVPTGVTDGFFDNRLQATISAPHIVDTTLIPGSYFDYYVSIGPWHDNPLQKMWGFQFILSFDPNIITPVDYEAVAVSDEGYKFDLGPSELGMDYVAISANSYFGDIVGLSSTAPVVVARIGFVVVDTGVTLMTLSGTAIADVDGNSLLHEVDSGSFANSNNISVSLNAIFVEARKWSVSMDGTMFTLTMQSTNTGAGITPARAVFKVYDSHGVVVAIAITPNVDTYPGTTVRFATQIDVSKLSYPASYVVEGTVEYLDSMGTWTTGHKGSPTSTRMSMIKTFSLYP